MNHHEKIRQFINSNLVIFDTIGVQFSDDDNIFGKGFVNSLFAMQMLNYIESEFAITVDNDELEIENFSSVNNIVALIEKKVQGSTST